jgi:LPXTG-motif cell wall-anchored protein
MKRGFSTALAAAAVLNLLVGLTAASGPDTRLGASPSVVPAGTDAQPPVASASAPPEGGRAVASPLIGTGKPNPKPKARRKAHETHVKAAGAGSVTIRDFSFGPSSVTVHVGETVTWSNQGHTAHTATARNGSFDTGTLKAGRSGSHTFAQAGTISYFCSIHPFMHGTVVVAAAAGGSTGSSGKPAGSAASPPATSPSKPGLPNTGIDVGSLLLSGALLLGSGLLLRRRAA